MRLGYSTNSIGDIHPLNALSLLSDLGFTSLAITLDHNVLNPFSSTLPAEIVRWRAALKAAGMSCVIETGARHLLEPLKKHEPTLVTADQTGRDRRSDFLKRAIDIAADLDALCVSLWSGVVGDSAAEEAIWQRLTETLRHVLEHASARGVVLGFEPEPGMFIDTLARYGQLLKRLDHPPSLQLTIDSGHMECMGERPIAVVLQPWVHHLVNVHIDDMLACRHEHLPLGSGAVAFAPFLATLAAAGYTGGLHVELPRQSHRWPEIARQSANFLRLVTMASKGAVCCR
jgi:sugar phosphate isomerase/epimerase